jgi:hypothetical protein
MPRHRRMQSCARKLPVADISVSPALHAVVPPVRENGVRERSSDSGGPNSTCSAESAAFCMASVMPHTSWPVRSGASFAAAATDAFFFLAACDALLFRFRARFFFLPKPWTAASACDSVRVCSAYPEPSAAPPGLRAPFRSLSRFRSTSAACACVSCWGRPRALPATVCMGS